MVQAVLFDLDGTLTDPKMGIVESVRFALAKEGIAPPPANELTWVIGPSLRESFGALANTDSSDLIERLMVHYRERFAPIGLYENEVFQGIPGVLQALQTQGIKCCVATSKPEVYAKEILRHFDLAHFFTEICGSELNGMRERKAEVIEEVLRRSSLSAAACIMVGDRQHDIVGAKEHGMKSIGVVFGFGGAEELKRAGADYIVERPEEILDIVLRGEASA